MRLHRWIVAAASRLVPKDMRPEWRAEWEGELHHRESSAERWPGSRRGRFNLVRQSTGAFWDALWLRSSRWYSLRLFGLEPGINDNAYLRGIVIHGTPGVSEAKARRGAQGRTEGCPAVPSESARRLIGRIANGSVVFAWYPDREFLEKSGFLDRGAAAERLGSMLQ